MFNVIGILSILSGINLYRNFTAYSAIVLVYRYSEGLTLSGVAIVMAIGMGIAGLFCLFSRNGRRKVCIIISSVFYLVPALLSLLLKFEELELWISLGIMMTVLFIVWVCIQKYEEA